LKENGVQDLAGAREFMAQPIDAPAENCIVEEAPSSTQSTALLPLVPSF
jgi:hypothetical protein